MTIALRLAAAVSILLATSPCGAAAPKSAASAPLPAAASAASAASAEAPTDFAGDLEPGRSYLGDFIYDANALRIWRPVKDVQLPPNSAWTIDWVNLAKFPALAGAAARARPQRLRFKVLQVDVSSGHPTMPWTAVYRCQIEAVEKPPPLPPPPAKAPPGRSAKMAR
jgi:hypothetical protein